MHKKILLISFEFPPKIGGAGSVAFEYAKYLSDVGNDVTVISLGNRKIDDFSFRVISVKSPKKVHLWYVYRKFLDEYNTNVFDKIILNDAGASMMASLFFKDEHKKKSIVFIHGSEDKKLVKNTSLLFRLTGIKKKYYQLLLECASIVSVSNHLKEKFIKVTRLYSIEGKINVIKNNINYPICNINLEHSLRRNLETNSKDYILLSASRIVRGKGYDEMLRIFSTLIKIDARYKWFIAGDGEYRKILESKVQEANLGSHIKFLGALRKDELFEYYNLADVFWLLSNFDEGFGLVYLEAALSGCPVMGYNRGGVKEAVNEKTGFLVDSEKSALNILREKLFLNFERQSVMESATEINVDMRHLILDLI